MVGCRPKGHNYVCLVLLLLGYWMITGGVACPAPCECVSNLYVYCDNRNITDEDVASVLQDIPTGTTVIDLSYNNLTSIPPGSLSRFSELIYFDSSHNEIVNISGVFSNLLSLQKIFLNGNMISSLKNNTFMQMQSLREVQLDKNRISAIEYCAFIKTLKLEKVSLNHNEFTNITSHMLSSLSSVISLDISNNQISKISDDAFSSLVNLKVLSAKHNQLSSISTRTFAGMSELERLDLDGNNISEINGEYFTNFKKSLKEMSLRSNNIRTISGSVFFGMKALTVLDLSYNDINHLGSYLFNGLSLNEVHLQGNKIREITNKMLGGSRKVIHLDLSLNEIESINDGAFDSFRESIYDLHLESNNLGRILHGTFDGMRYLQTVNLANNSISFIEEGAFKDLINLKKLDLSWNRLSVVKPAMFQGVDALKQLHLQYNPLQHFEWSDFSAHEDNLDISLNLTFEKVTSNSALVKWPYKEGSQIYWSRYVKCVGAEQCQFRSQAKFLAPYEKELNLSNLSPASRYYVCINPAFKMVNVNMQQCGHVRTSNKIVVITTPESVVTTDSISRSEKVIHSANVMTLTLISAFCYLKVL